MSLFDPWVKITQTPNGKLKSLWTITENADQRANVMDQLAKAVRAHYDSLEQIKADIDELGYAKAALILGERLPRGRRARSGELGEILATELVEAELSHRVPVRRLRYKDGREMALRGDDLIGVEAKLPLRLLKGEAKSRATLGVQAVKDARSVLSRDSGRPTPSSLLFVVDRLLEGDDDDKKLGRLLRNEVANKALPPAAIDHFLFTLSGNSTPAALSGDLKNADSGRRHIVVHMEVSDHADFIADIYKRAGELGND